MITTVSSEERLSTTRQHLNKLRENGYRYLVTPDDGDTWIGSEDRGLEIDELIMSGFIGKIAMEKN